MKKYWKIGMIILILASAITIFSISMARKDDKPTPRVSPQIAQRRPRRIPPLFQQAMKEEGISPEDLKDNPELQKKIKEKVEELRVERRRKAKPGPAKEEAPKPAKPSKKTEVVPKERQKINEEDYYKVIVEKNLFRPLGSGAEKKGPVFRLLGTIIAKTKGEVDMALIMDYQRHRSDYVAEGEKIGNAIVKKIELRRVALFHEGEMKNFGIQSVQFIGAKGEGGGRGSPSIGSSAPATRRSSGPNKAQQARMKAEMMKGDRREKIAQFREKIEIMKKQGRSEEEIKEVITDFKERMGERGDRRNRPRR